MNRNQKIVLWLAILAFGLTLTNAPYERPNPRGPVSTKETGPIWDPSYRGQLMASVLFVEWIAIGIGAGLLMFALKGQRVHTPERNQKTHKPDATELEEEPENARIKSYVVASLVPAAIVGVVFKGDIFSRIGSAIGVIVVGLLLAGFMFALAALGGQRMSQKKFFKAIAIGSWITLASFLYAGQ